MKKFIFDVDGTLTPARQNIRDEFLPFFYDFVLHNEVYLVTGSDRDKTIKQISPGIYNNCKRVYNCSGSDVYEGDLSVYRDEWELPIDVEQQLKLELCNSAFPIRNGNHIERRPGGVNFTIMGRGDNTVSLLERQAYVDFDNKTNERKNMAERLRNMFPNLEVQIGGQTGLDLGPIGNNKSQIMRDFKDESDIIFFGDMMEEGEIDYDIAVAVEKQGGKAYSVTDWEDTRQKLIGLQH